MTPIDGIETWIFDLDNTLYPPSARLFDQINARMTAFIMAELGLDRAAANRLRTEYWQRYGTTLKGLIECHRVDPERFLSVSHAIDYGALRPDPRLGRAVAGLSGRKIVHTNGPRAHARAVLAALGLSGAFDAVFAIEDKALVPKPQPRAYAAVHRLAGLDPRHSAMVEDDARNLSVPKALGMATVWLCHSEGAPTPAHVDRRIARLTEFLEAQAAAA